MLKALEIRGLSTGSHSCKIILNFIKQKEKKLKKIMERVLTVKNKVTEGSTHQRIIRFTSIPPGQSTGMEALNQH